LKDLDIPYLMVLTKSRLCHWLGKYRPKGHVYFKKSQNAPLPQFKMLLWPNQMEIFNHAFRCIKAGSSLTVKNSRGVSQFFLD